MLLRIRYTRVQARPCVCVHTYGRVCMYVTTLSLMIFQISGNEESHPKDKSKSKNF